MKPEVKMQQPIKTGGTAATRNSVTDPVCGMTVNPEAASGSYEYNEETYYFCSSHCLHKFREDPKRFLNKSTESMASQLVGIQRESNPAQLVAQTYTCPMHPEVRQDKPGSCPKCGMALEPVTVTAPQQKIEYTCPMHPEIVRDAPGNCPICGMALEPRTATFTEEENHELKDMRRRFWVSVAFSIPVFVIGMSDLIPGAPFQRLIPPAALT